MHFFQKLSPKEEEIKELLKMELLLHSQMQRSDCSTLQPGKLQADTGLMCLLIETWIQRNIFLLLKKKK